MRLSTRSRLVVVGCGLALVAPATAQALDSQVGAVFDPTVSCTGPFTALQTASGAGRSAVVPADGVVTSWRFRANAESGPETVGLRMGRASGAASGFDLVGASTNVQQTPGQTTSSPTRLPVKAGDVLGLRYDGEGACAGDAGEGFALLLRFDEAGADVTSGPFAAQESGTEYVFDLAATVEPDADGDGFGDTTQDQCSTQASTQGACKDLVAPDTTITSAKAQKIKAAAQGKKAKKRAKVTVAFAANEAATFTCSVDGAAYKACSSPLVLKLKKGTHDIAVKATDAAGNVDPTPATTTVKVKKAKAKRK